MAAVNDVSSAERHKQWYDDDVTEINPEIRQLLESYSKIPSAEVVKHVNEIRARGFAANPYPCIGRYRFLNLTLLTHPLYPTLLTRLKSDRSAIYLDLGCCFGQDLRQLAADGIPSSQLVGLDIEKPLMDLGYDLFLDQDTLESKFHVLDLFKGASGEQAEVWQGLEELGADVVHCSAFFHLFPLPEQIVVAKNVARLVRKGGVIVGRQSGSVKPGEVPAIKAGSTSWRHDLRTLGEMWDRVGEETGTKWSVDGSLDMVGYTGAKKVPVEDENSRRLLFAITRAE
ncbi:MAG: hypothetical protein MMC23_005729 [Stictis urceolatum]|nr:hypothetical protein [Stictis urceolata]